MQTHYHCRHPNCDYKIAWKRSTSNSSIRQQKNFAKASVIKHERSTDHTIDGTIKKQCVDCKNTFKSAEEARKHGAILCTYGGENYVPEQQAGSSAQGASTSQTVDTRTDDQVIDGWLNEPSSPYAKGAPAPVSGTAGFKCDPEEGYKPVKFGI